MIVTPWSLTCGLESRPGIYKGLLCDSSCVTETSRHPPFGHQNFAGEILNSHPNQPDFW